MLYYTMYVLGELWQAIIPIPPHLPYCCCWAHTWTQVDEGGRKAGKTARWKIRVLSGATDLRKTRVAD